MRARSWLWRGKGTEQWNPADRTLRMGEIGRDGHSMQHSGHAAGEVGELRLQNRVRTVGEQAADPRGHVVKPADFQARFMLNAVTT